MCTINVVKATVGVIALAFISLFSSCSSRVWEKDDAALFEYVFDKLSARSDYGHDLSALNEQEKVFMSMALLAQEVNNGGFDQFFFNLDGRYDDILVSSAEAVGAFDIAGICEKALAVYAEHAEETEFIEKLGPCDDAFYASTDAICELCAQYVREHKDSFRLK